MTTKATEKLWGCEVVDIKTLDKSLAHFLSRANLVMLRVLVRQKGLTSSGTFGHCYSNVENLVDVFGGKRIVGWCYDKIKKRQWMDRESSIQKEKWHLVGHACWLNDKNHLSCVTGKSWIGDQQWDRYLYKKNKKTYIDFIVFGEAQKGLAVLNNIEIDKGEKVKEKSIEFWDYIIQQKNSCKYEEFDETVLQKYARSEETKYESQLIKTDVYELIAANKRMKLAGHFSEKSIATGRTLDEIRADRIKRKS